MKRLTYKALHKRAERMDDVMISNWETDTNDGKTQTVYGVTIIFQSLAEVAEALDKLEKDKQ